MTGAAPVQTHTFESMGSTVELILTGGSRREAAVAFARAEALADEWDRTFSRFRPDSELSRLNAFGAPFHASRQLFVAVETALDAARATDGLFDPTILPALLKLGYDRPYAQILSAGRDVPETAGAAGAPPRCGWKEVVLDGQWRLISLPEDVLLDLGGVAKGLYADRLMEELSGWPGGMISAGGDMRLWGVPPNGGRWIVGVEDPGHPDKNIAWLELANGGVATSGTNRRHWRQMGHAVHHLIDPRTGRSVDGPLRSVTVVAETAAVAEVASTALFVMGGMPDGASWLVPTILLAVGVGPDDQMQMLYHRLEGHRHAA